MVQERVSLVNLVFCIVLCCSFSSNWCQSRAGFRDNYFYVSAFPLKYGALVIRPKKDFLTKTQIDPRRIFIESKLYLSDNKPEFLKGNAELGHYNLELKQFYDNAGTLFSFGAEYRLYCSLLDQDGKKIRDLIARTVLDIAFIEKNGSLERLKQLRLRGFSYDPLHMSSSKEPTAKQVATGAFVIGAVITSVVAARAVKKKVSEINQQLNEKSQAVKGQINRAERVLGILEQEAKEFKTAKSKLSEYIVLKEEEAQLHEAVREMEKTKTTIEREDNKLRKEAQTLRARSDELRANLHHTELFSDERKNLNQEFEKIDASLQKNARNQQKNENKIETLTPQLDHNKRSLKQVENNIKQLTQDTPYLQLLYGGTKAQTIPEDVSRLLNETRQAVSDIRNITGTAKDMLQSTHK